MDIHTNNEYVYHSEKYYKVLILFVFYSLLIAKHILVFITCHNLGTCLKPNLGKNLKQNVAVNKISFVMLVLS